MKRVAVERWIAPAVGLAAVLSIGIGWSVDLWSAHAPWVAPVYQDVLLEASDCGLAALGIFALVAGRASATRRLSSPARVTAVAGGVLLALLALSVPEAIAPPLSVAATARVGLGLLVYLAVTRRPCLGRWLVIGFGGLILLELPLIALQEATQSQFPLLALLGIRGDPVPASTAGAFIVFGPGGTRWQRALGSFPHPNVLGGFLAVALVLALPLRERPPFRPAAHGGKPTPSPWTGRAGVGALPIPSSAAWWILWIIGWVELVFSFSRAGLLAALLGCGIWWISQRGQGRSSLVGLLVAPVLALAGAAVVAGPFLLPRLAPTPDLLTSTPVSGRLLLGPVAGALILAHPIFGVGAGNFTLAELAPPFDAVAVDPVHVVPLLVAAEAGVPAGLAWVVLVVGGPIAEWRQRGFGSAAGGDLALPVAVLTLAMLDHYLWTLGAGRAIFWLGLAGWAVTPRKHREVSR